MYSFLFILFYFITIQDLRNNAYRTPALHVIYLKFFQYIVILRKNYMLKQHTFCNIKIKIINHVEQIIIKELYLKFNLVIIKIIFISKLRYACNF